MVFLKNIKVLPGWLFLLLVLGCSEKQEEQNPVPESNSTAKCLLAKHTTAVNTTLSVSDFTYDAAGRLTRAAYSSPVSPGGNSYVDITYNAAGQVARIADFDRNNVAGNHKVFSYNAGGQPDTIANYRGATPLGYTVYEYNAAGQLTRESVFTPFDSLSLHYAAFTYPAADRTTIMRYKRNANGTASLDNTTQLLYDDKRHPYAELGYFYEPLLYSRHNVLTSTITYSGQAYVNEQTYTYDYNAAGYPVKQIITSGQSSAQTVNTFTYNCQ